MGVYTKKAEAEAEAESDAESAGFIDLTIYISKLFALNFFDYYYFYLRVSFKQCMYFTCTSDFRI